VHTQVDLALEANNMKFVAHHDTQTYVDRIWGQEGEGDGKAQAWHTKQMKYFVIWVIIYALSITNFIPPMDDILNKIRGEVGSFELAGADHLPKQLSDMTTLVSLTLPLFRSVIDFLATSYMWLYWLSYFLSEVVQLQHFEGSEVSEGSFGASLKGKFKMYLADTSNHQDATIIFCFFLANSIVIYT
jgi:hypothetical protein